MIQFSKQSRKLLLFPGQSPFAFFIKGIQSCGNTGIFADLLFQLTGLDLTNAFHLFPGVFGNPFQQGFHEQITALYSNGSQCDNTGIENIQEHTHGLGIAFHHFVPHFASVFIAVTHGKFQSSHINISNITVGMFYNG